MLIIYNTGEHDLIKNQSRSIITYKFWVITILFIPNIEKLLIFIMYNIGEHDFIKNQPRSIMKYNI